MKSKKKSKKYGVGGSSNPLKDLNDMQFARKGVAVGSMLEGGRIMYKGGTPGGPDQEVDLDEVDADTSNLFTGAFSNIKARRYSKKNPGATGVSYKPSGGFRKRRKTTTFQDGEKGDIVRRLGI